MKWGIFSLKLSPDEHEQKFGLMISPTFSSKLDKKIIKNCVWVNFGQSICNIKKMFPRFCNFFRFSEIVSASYFKENLRFYVFHNSGSAVLFTNPWMQLPNRGWQLLIRGEKKKGLPRTSVCLGSILITYLLR